MVSLKASVAVALDCQSVAARPVEGPVFCAARPELVPPAVVPMPAVPDVEAGVDAREAVGMGVVVGVGVVVVVGVVVGVGVVVVVVAVGESVAPGVPPPPPPQAVRIMASDKTDSPLNKCFTLLFCTAFLPVVRLLARR